MKFTATEDLKEIKKYVDHFGRENIAYNKDLSAIFKQL